jgi:hypothetical protein
MHRMIASILSCIALLFLPELAAGSNLKQTDRQVLSKASRITIPFVENKGQFADPNTLFYSNTFAGQVTVNRGGSIGYRLVGNKTGKQKQLCEIRETLGGGLNPSPSGGRPAVAKVNHFQGQDPKKWLRNLSTYDTVDMGEVYPGVQLTLKAHGNNVEKIFHVHPGTDSQKIRLTIDGAQTLKLTSKGELQVDTGAGAMRFARPVAYQWVDGRKIAVDAAYTVNGKSYGFQVAAYDRTKELIIDPLITAIFHGATDTYTLPTCIAADSQGNIYVAGISERQFAVFKFDNRLETMLGAALFGSDHNNRNEKTRLYDIAIDSQDAIYLVGSTDDENFPVTEGAFDAVLDGGEFLWLSDGFVTKYNADLNTLLASTFIGEDGFDAAYGIAVAQDNTVYVVGEAESPDPNQTPFPTSPNAYDTIPGEHRKTKAFVMHLDSELKTMLASTLLGYNGDLKAGDEDLNDRAYDVAIDASGDIVVAGVTESGHFPVTANCVDASFQGESEVFVSKFDPDLQHLSASTFLGGASSEQVNALAIAANNEILVAGWTLSSDFPVFQGSYDTIYNLYEDGFVSRLRNDLTAISASTFLGGDGVEQISDMVIGGDGRVFLCGGTDSTNFPVTENADDRTFNGSWPNSNTSKFDNGDGFLAIFDQALTTLSQSTYLGGRDGDHSAAILVNNDDIIVAGETRSDNFPYMIEKKGDSDGFVCRFNPNETPEDLPSARPGHWQSKDSGAANMIHLDIDICEDGSFQGIWRGYYCYIDVGCFITDQLPPKPVHGTLDFKNFSGTLTLDEDCKNLPISIFKQSPDKLHIGIVPGDETDKCLGSFISYLDYEGESEYGKCPEGPDDGGDDDDGGGGGSDNKGGGGNGGGGGGGCFIASLED